ncbi:hypothetical protein AAMO2058_001658300 [Amorphochlora amoebiformis]
MGEILSKCFVDVDTLPDDAYGFIQLLTLLVAYGYVVVVAARGIGEGCELLMAYSPPMAALVGPILLPILGAVPDSMIILFSGLGSDAQEKLNIGVGALAGSTIMLLTIPWFVTIFTGRLRLDSDGKTIHPKGRSKDESVPFWPLTKSGINVTTLVPKSSKALMMTSLSYLLMQIPALFLGCGYKGAQCDEAGERWWALAAFLLCVLGFCGYLYYSIKSAQGVDTAPVWIGIYERQIRQGSMDIVDAAFHLAEQQGLKPDSNQMMSQQYLLVDDDLEKQIRTLVIRFWVKYGKGSKLSRSHLELLLESVNLNSHEKEILMNITRDKGAISLDDVVSFIFNRVSAKQILEGSELKDSYLSPSSRTGKKKRVSLYSMAHDIAAKDQLYKTDSKAARAQIIKKIKVFWDKNTDSSDGIDKEGLKRLLPMMGIESDDQHIQTFLKAIDQDDDQKLSIGEMADFLLSIATHRIRNDDIKHEKDPDNHIDEEEEDFELPKNIADLPESERKAAILKSSVISITISTIAVILVSDPICDVLSALGERIGISPFYVSFILAPLASNGSEMGAAYTLARRKTKSKVTAGVSQLLGAGSMNNTMALGVFLALIFSRGLKWTFTAETISILLVELVSGIVGLKTSQTLLDGCIILSMYPISLAVVVVLESFGLQ